MPKTITKIFASLLICAAIFTNFAGVAEAGEAPYQRTFIISAYYSPLPGQSYYFRGSYDADRILNGNGTNGADGTEVYPGMLAAPKSYAFGTHLEIPGLGVGTIHDRGGAIVDAGVRSNAYDRIDVWMGKGEEGLARALQWGMRTVTATVYPASYEIADNFSFDDVGAAALVASVAKTQLTAGSTKSSRFPVSLGDSDRGEKVAEMQIGLVELGVCGVEINGVFDEEIEKCVLKFQLDEGVISSENETGAGYFGTRTRAALETALEKFEAAQEEKIADQLLSSTLSPNSSGEEVKLLQSGLARLGYFSGEVTGNYTGDTIAAVAEFQVDADLLATTSSYGAGWFGEKTKESFNTALRRSLLTLPSVPENPVVDRGIYQPNFARNLALGDSGDEVRKLQKTLTELGYFDHEATGYFGAVTQAAVLDFQIAYGVVGSSSEAGAGSCGPKTISTLNFAVEKEQVAFKIESAA